MTLPVRIRVVYANGQPYHVIDASHDDRGELLTVRRPNGIKTYSARPLPDHPLYGEYRAVIEPTSAKR